MSHSSPLPCVGALIFNHKGEIFLMKSPAWNGKYVIPGGHVELGETLEDALRREIKEETNLDIVEIEFLTYLEHIFEPNFNKKKHFIFFDFICRTDQNEVILNEEATEYIWVKPNEALSLDLVDSVKPIIKMVIEIEEDEMLEKLANERNVPGAKFYSHEEAWT